MNRTEYYEHLKKLARAVRVEYGLTTARVTLSDLRRIYAAHDIRVDLWSHPLKNLRGAYFNDDYGASVLISKRLPSEQRIFTMSHELKHHLADRERGLSYCDPSNERAPIEVGAEIFAAELIFPEPDFAAALEKMGVELGECTPETIVHLKQRESTTLSYTSLAKRAEWMGFAPSGSLQGVRWKTLAEDLLGEPIYKRIQRYRSRRDRRSL